MQLGAMINPRIDPEPQIDWIGRNKFDYVEITVEPPAADLPDLKPVELREALACHDLGVIVHTSPYLPVANPHAAARGAAREELLRTLELAHRLGSPLMSAHSMGTNGWVSIEETAAIYAEMMAVLVRAAEPKGVRIVLENSTVNRNEIGLFQRIFRKVPGLGLLLDIAHAHLHVDTNLTRDFLADPILGGRLCHVHVSDNDGKRDLHLPPGAVRNGIDWLETIRLLKRHPYDGRITLEVFSPDRDYLIMSRDKFVAWWNEVPGPEAQKLK